MKVLQKEFSYALHRDVSILHNQQYSYEAQELTLMQYPYVIYEFITFSLVVPVLFPFWSRITCCIWLPCLCKSPLMWTISQSSYISVDLYTFDEGIPTGYFVEWFSIRVCLLMIRF